MNCNIGKAILTGLVGIILASSEEKMNMTEYEDTETKDELSSFYKGSFLLEEHLSKEGRYFLKPNAMAQDILPFLGIGGTVEVMDTTEGTLLVGTLSWQHGSGILLMYRFTLRSESSTSILRLAAIL